MIPLHWGVFLFFIFSFILVRLFRGLGLQAGLRGGSGSKRSGDECEEGA